MNELVFVLFMLLSLIHLEVLKGGSFVL
jgi:hypothetical protein